MTMKHPITYLAVLIVSLLSGAGPTKSATCEGQFPDILKDICWACIFPIKIGKIAMNALGQGDNKDPGPPWICECPTLAGDLKKGVGISFWEPVAVVEVVKTPLCSPTLNGTVLGNIEAPIGTINNGSISGENGYAFYHTHWIEFPLFNWLDLNPGGPACQLSTDDKLEVSYLSELSPTYDDDELSFILNPEAILFAQPQVQAACAADTKEAISTEFGHDELFWCSGSQGSIYPLTGSRANLSGGIDNSLSLTHSAVYRKHKEFELKDTSTFDAICQAKPQPIMRKNQYKQQMMHPIPQNTKGYGFGFPSNSWGSAREYPYVGEDFSYLIWRKKQCCVD